MEPSETLTRLGTYTAADFKIDFFRKSTGVFFGRYSSESQIETDYPVQCVSEEVLRKHLERKDEVIIQSGTVVWVDVASDSLPSTVFLPESSSINDLVEKYRSGFLEKEALKKKAEEKVEFLSQINHEGSINQQRGELLAIIIHSQFVSELELEKKAVAALIKLFDTSTLYLTVENAELQSLQNIEEALRKLCEELTSKEGSLRGSGSLLFEVLTLYTIVLEHIWLYRCLKTESEEAQNAGLFNHQKMSESFQQWMSVLLREASDPKSVFFLKRVCLMFSRVTEKTDITIAEKIIGLKPHLSNPLLSIYIGEIYESIFDYFSSYINFTKSLKIIYLLEANGAHSLGGLKIQTLLDIGNSCFQLGLYKMALNALNQAWDLCKDEESIRTKVHCLNLIGRCNLYLGSHKEAREALKDALILSEGAQNNGLIGTVYTELGILSNTEGDYSNALECYTKALKATTEPEELLEVKLNMGNTYLNLCQYPRALEHFLKILEELPSENIPMRLNLWGSIGNCYFFLGNYNEAYSAFEKCLPLAVKKGSKKNLAEVSFNLGNCCQELKDYQQAHKRYSDAMALAEEIGDVLSLSLAYGGLARHLFSCGKFHEALNYFHKQLNLENINDDSRALIYNNMSAVHFEDGQFDLARKCLEDSLRFLKASQADIHLDYEFKISLSERHSLIFRGFERVSLYEKNTLRALELADSRRYKVLIKSLLKKSPSKLNPMESQELSSLEMQQLAQRQNTTFIVFSLSSFSEKEPTLDAWVISSNQIEYRKLSVESVKEDVRGTEKLLRAFPYLSRGPTPPQETESLKALSELSRGGYQHKRFIKAKLRPWYEAFLAPLEDLFPKDPQKTITIVPDGFLAQLPFAAMQDQEGRYLIEKHPISVVPSMKTVQLLEVISQERVENSLRGAFLLGNPVTRPELKLDPLVIGEAEANELKEVFDSGRAKVSLKEEATVTCFLEHCSSARWIHASCHGESKKPEFEPHSVFEGQLMLTPDEQHTSGILHSKEISSLDLKAELVFLSACYSGTGRVQQEGVIGHIWSFLAAGALSTVGAYWRIPETEATKEMVKCFYRHLLGVGTTRLNKAQALQQAMLFGMKHDREAIEQWGAFYLSGLS